MTNFYETLAQISFTIFGLWLVVMELRGRELGSFRQQRWGARIVAMHFALPGIMSLLTLANPDSSLLWRISFAMFALLGAVGIALLGPRRGSLPPLLSTVAHWLGVGLYLVVAFVAAFPKTLASRLDVTPLQIESVLLSLILFVGLNLAFSLLLGAPTGPADEPGDASRA